MSQPNRLKRFADTMPVLFSLLAIIIVSLTTEIPVNLLVQRWFDEAPSILIKVAFGHLFSSALLLWLLRKLDLMPTAGFTPLREWRSLWLLWPFVLYIAMNYDGLISGAFILDSSRPWLVGLLVIVNLSIGLCEELMGRSLVLMLMMRVWGHDRRGVYKAVLVSSVIFGVAHIGNAITGHLPWINAVVQVAYSLFFGVLFAACFLRTNAVIPLMLAHALVDFGPSFRHIAVNAAELAPPPYTWESAAISLAITFPALVYGLIILRKYRINDFGPRTSTSGSAIPTT